MIVSCISVMQQVSVLGQQFQLYRDRQIAAFACITAGAGHPHSLKVSSSTRRYPISRMLYLTQRAVCLSPRWYHDETTGLLCDLTPAIPGEEGLARCGSSAVGFEHLYAAWPPVFERSPEPLTRAVSATIAGQLSSFSAHVCSYLQGLQSSADQCIIMSISADSELLILIESGPGSCLNQRLLPWVCITPPKACMCIAAAATPAAEFQAANKSSMRHRDRYHLQIALRGAAVSIQLVRSLQQVSISLVQYRQLIFQADHYCLKLLPAHARMPALSVRPSDVDFCITPDYGYSLNLKSLRHV